MKFKFSKAPSSRRSKRPFFPKKGKEAKGDAFFSPSNLQAKLSMGQPGDRFELEADAVADKLVKKGEQRVGLSSEQQVQQKEEELATKLEVQRMEEEEEAMQAKEELQRQPMEEEEEMMQPKEELQRQPMEEEEEELMPKLEQPQPGIQSKETEGLGENSGSPLSDPDFARRLQKSRGSGDPLPEDLRLEMEAALGVDLSLVRIHTGAEAIALTRELKAQAFTQGVDIYFNKGKFNPQTESGKHLLAHELTHVIQQRGK